MPAKPEERDCDVGPKSEDMGKCVPAMKFLAESIHRDCGPEHEVDWDPTGYRFLEIHGEYVADWDQPLRFYLMYNRNGTFKWVPGGALWNFPKIVATHE